MSKKKKTTKKTAKRRPIVPSPRNEPAIVVVELGTVLAVEYRHTEDGKKYRHDFKGGKTKIHRTRDGSKLIIAPVRVGRFIED